jgi:hypothetical protein
MSRISELPADDAITGTESLPTLDGGVNRRVTIQQIATFTKTNTTPTEIGAADADHTHTIADLGGITSMRLVGRFGPGPGGAQEIQIGANLTLSDDTLSAVAQLPQIAQFQVLGRSSEGTGPVELLTFGAGFTITAGGVVLNQPTKPLIVEALGYAPIKTVNGVFADIDGNLEIETNDAVLAQLKKLRTQIFLGLI